MSNRSGDPARIILGISRSPLLGSLEMTFIGNSYSIACHFEPLEGVPVLSLPKGEIPETTLYIVRVLGEAVAIWPKGGDRTDAVLHLTQPVGADPCVGPLLQSPQ